MKRLTLALVLGTSVTAFATGDGGGINGPDLGGIAIPVKVDGMVDTKAIVKAYDTCFHSGDKSRNIQSMIQRLYFQIYGNMETVTPKYNLDENNILFFYKDDGHGRQTKHSYPQMQSQTCQVANGNINECISNNENSLLFRGWVGFSNNGILEQGGELRVGDINHPRAKLDLLEIVPYISWTQEDLICDGYDELGSCTNRHAVPKDLVMVKGKRHGARVYLNNVDTGKQSNVFVNAEEIAQCLLSEIANNARK